MTCKLNGHHHGPCNSRCNSDVAPRTTRQDFTKPAKNDASGHCVSCGRDNNGYKGQPCSDDCPMYWEEIGIENPDYPKVKS